MIQLFMKLIFIQYKYIQNILILKKSKIKNILKTCLQTLTTLKNLYCFYQSNIHVYLFTLPFYISLYGVLLIILIKKKKKKLKKLFYYKIKIKKKKINKKIIKS